MIRFENALPAVCVVALAWIAPTGSGAQVPPLRSDIYSQYREDSRFDLASQPEANDRIGTALATGDFNGDGHEDLAIGCAFEDFGSSTSQLVDSGWVTVIKGGPEGVDASPGVEDIPWDQDGDVEGGAEAGDQVGFSVAVGDFNGDGYDDLVMGSPGEDITLGGTTDANAGSINVIYGSSDGLQLAGNRQFFQERELNGHTVPGASEAGDQFGRALAVGDFDNDGRDDLAIGLPFEDIGSITDAGGVVILYGKPVIGLDPERARYIARDSAGMVGSPGAFDNFGVALAAGDFNGDGTDDLAIGVPNDSVAANSAGAVDIVPGSPSGLDPMANEQWTLDTPGVAGVAASGDALGAALATGNFDGDLFDDLVVGLPGRDGGSVSDHGGALVVYGTGGGLGAARSRYLEQGMGGVPGVNDADDRWGQALAVGDVNGDGADDVLIGIPGERVLVDGNTRDGAGAAQLLVGLVGSGLVTAGEAPYSYSLVGNAATADGFGSAVALGDFDRDGKDDLVFAIPRRLVRDANNQNISAAGEIVVSHTGGVFNDGFERGDLSAWTTVVP